LWSDYAVIEESVLERLGTVAIVGVGLIGASIGLALRARGLASRVIGIGRDIRTLELARDRGAIDRATIDLSEGTADAEVVVVCTPVSRIPQDVRNTVEVAPAQALVTDAGSTKRQIVEQVERHPPAAGVFVGAHPLAGSERSGAAFAREGLFDDRACILTPTARTPRDRLDRAREFWTGLGCRVFEMNPSEHDEVLAYTSHLPHALAAALASSVPSEWFALTAGAFRDGTRVAGADTALWTAIFRDNRGPLLKALGTLQERVAAFKYAVMTDDEDAIRRWWDEARQRRGLFEAQQPIGEKDL
jgi:prephenate dehydrogenase